MAKLKRGKLKQIDTLRKRTALGFRNLQQDDNMADEIEEMTPEEFAEWKGIEIINNPSKTTKQRRFSEMPASKPISERLREKEDIIDDLEEENQGLRDTLAEIRGIVSDDDDDDDDEEEEEG